MPHLENSSSHRRSKAADSEAQMEVDALIWSLLVHWCCSMRGSTRVYQCRWRGCQRMFADSSNVRRHEKAHLGMKSFVCLIDGCRKTFARKATVQSHLATAHSGNCGDGVRQRPFESAVSEGLVQCTSKQELTRRMNAELVEQALHQISSR